ncbi:MAG: peptidylprolyl isomerase [Alphaproteobacteria bacterium]|nr:peptidylprolyl isomerase [Alphaproteobacteria bacterium]
MARIVSAFVALVMGVLFMTDQAQALDPENTLYLDTKNGRVIIEMRPDVAPKHVARIKALTRAGFYDGLTFHRVIDGFMAQTGDPKGNGTGGYTDASGMEQYLPAEFSMEPFKRGAVGMARAQDINSASSQFFIMFAPAPHLNGQYTVWGYVTEGMDVVDKINHGKDRRGNIDPDPDTIVKMQVAADAK